MTGARQWLLFAACFFVSEILFKQRIKLSAGIKGFSGGMLIALVCFWIIPVNFMENVFLSAGLMLAGIFLGEMLHLNDACDMALWFMASIFMFMGGLLYEGLTAVGGGLLLYIGCKMALPENLEPNLNVFSRLFAFFGFITAIFLSIFIR